MRRMRHRFVPLVPVVLGLAASSVPTPAAAVVLDNFEWGGPFACAAASPQSCTFISLTGNLLHVMTHQRRIELVPDEFGTIVMLPQFEQDDGVRVTFDSGGGLFSHVLDSDCEGPAVDLTEGGTHDRLELRFDQATTPLDVDVEIVWNEGADTTVSSIFVTGPGTYAVPLGAPITSACRTRIEVRATAPGLFCLTDVRTAASGYFAAAWQQDVFTLVGTPPLVRLAYGIEQGGDIGVLGDVGLTLESAVNDGGGAFSVQAGFAALPSPCSLAPLFESMQGSAWFGGLPQAAAVNLLMRFDFQPAQGTWLLDAAPEVFASGDAFEVVFVTRREFRGETTSVWRHAIAFDPPEGAAWKIDSLVAQMPASGPANEFRVLVRVIPTEGADPDDTILQLHQTASRAIPGGGATDVPGFVGPAAAPESSRLRAAPGVTSSGTRFLLAGWHGADENVDVFDVRGRRVREIPIRGGEGSWDGRNERGDRVSAGMYLARLRSTKATTKVTLIR